MNVNSKNPPIIIFHGEKDNVVPCCQGKEFYELLKTAGVTTEATFVPEGVRFLDKAKNSK